MRRNGNIPPNVGSTPLSLWELKTMKVFVVGYSNSGRHWNMLVDARDAHHAAEVAQGEGAEVVLWIDGPFDSYEDADKYCEGRQ